MSKNFFHSEPSKYLSTFKKSWILSNSALCGVYPNKKKQSVPDRILPRLIILPFFYSTKALLSSLVKEDYVEKSEASPDNNENNNAEGLMKKDSSPESAAKSPTSSSTTTSTATFTLHNTFMDIVIR